MRGIWGFWRRGLDAGVAVCCWINGYGFVGGLSGGLRAEVGEGGERGKREGRFVVPSVDVCSRGLGLSVWM